MDDIFCFRRDPEEDYYEILGCHDCSTVDQINAEYKAKALIYHPDKNPHDPSVVLKFQRIQEAKEVLCDVVQRKEYDKWRSGGISIPYKQWMSMKKNSNTVWHWAIPKTENHMIKASDGLGSPSYTQQRKIISSDSYDSILQKFRNYEI